MRANELECVHGVGHSGDVHGCDGCCSIIARAVEERIIKLLEDRIISMSAYYSRLDEQEGLIRAIALIKGEQK